MTVKKICSWVFSSLLPMLSVVHGEYYSRSAQDQFVYETFFSNKPEGFFVDISASDGGIASPSCFFEKTLGWKGICVVPNPEALQQFKQSRTAMLIQAGVSG